MTDPTANDTGEQAAGTRRQPSTQAGNSTYWTLTAPPSLADVLEGLTEAIRETLPAIGEAFTAMSETLPGPAPAGLTAAQVKPWIEFGARLADRAIEVTVSDDDQESVMASLRAMAHQRDEAIVQVAELRTELLEAHADLEASRAREQIAAERVAQVLALCDEVDADDEYLPKTIATSDTRAILGGDRGEEQAATVDYGPVSVGDQSLAAKATSGGIRSADVTPEYLDEEARADG